MGCQGLYAAYGTLRLAIIQGGGRMAGDTKMTKPRVFEFAANDESGLMDVRKFVLQDDYLQLQHERDCLVEELAGLRSPAEPPAAPITAEALRKVIELATDELQRWPGERDHDRAMVDLAEAWIDERLA